MTLFSPTRIRYALRGEFPLLENRTMPERAHTHRQIFQGLVVGGSPSSQMENSAIYVIS